MLKFLKRLHLVWSKCAWSPSWIALPLRGYCHFPQGLDALLERGMGAEQRGYAAAEHGPHDAQRGSRRGKRGCRYPLVIGTQFLQRTHQAVRLAHHPYGLMRALQKL